MGEQNMKKLFQPKQKIWLKPPFRSQTRDGGGPSVGEKERKTIRQDAVLGQGTKRGPRSTAGDKKQNKAQGNSDTNWKHRQAHRWGHLI